MIIEGPESSRNHWSIGILESLIIGKDRVTRAAKVRIGKINFRMSNTAVIPFRAKL